MTLTCLSAKWRRAVCPSLFALGLVLSSTSLRADVCGTVAGNAVQNCGFETGSFSNWTLSGNLQGGAPPNSFYGVDASAPNSGSYEAYFGVQGGGGTAIGTLGPYLVMTQSLNLLPDEYYQLSFALNQNGPTNPPGYTNHFAALFGGVSVFSQTNAPNSGGYQTYTDQVSTASSTGLTSLEFDFQNDSDFFYLDDVGVKAVAPVPEPATLLLLLPSGGLLLWVARRRKLKAV